MKALHICLQGPKESTTGDFWQMVQERRCGVIIMLTRVTESGGFTKVGSGNLAVLRHWLGRCPCGL